MKTKNIIGGVIAVMATTGMLLFMLVMMFHDIPTANIDVFKSSMAALILLVTNAFSFYLGSSIGSMLKTQQKDEVKE